MKHFYRVVSLVLCAVILAGFPIAPVSFGTAITAAALDVTELQQLVDTIPDRSQWNLYYVDASTMGPAYDTAKNILANPNYYEQKDITSAVANLKLVLNSIQYHTRGLAVTPRDTSCPVGGSVTLTVAKEPTNGADPVSWVSNRPDIADVNSSGWVYVKKYSAEPVLISAVSNGTSSTCTLHITPADEPPTHTHVYVKEVKDAKYLKEEGNCTTKAVYYKSCSCGASAKDDATAAVQTFEGDYKHGEFELYRDEIPATCTKDGWTAIKTCKLCGRPVGGDKIPKETAPHSNIVKDVAVPATCIATGLTEGSHCAACNATIVAQQTVPMASHSPMVINETPETCAEQGVQNKIVCSVCTAVLNPGTVIFGNTHQWGNWKTFQSTDEDEPGIEVRFCSVCGAYELREAKQSTDSAVDEPKEDLNFFQRIIQWLRDLFAKLFGKKS